MEGGKRDVGSGRGQEREEGGGRREGGGRGKRGEVNGKQFWHAS